MNKVEKNVVRINTFDKTIAKLDEINIVVYSSDEIIEQIKQYNHSTDDWLTYFVVSFNRQDQTQRIELVAVPEDETVDSMSFQIDWDTDALKSFLEFYYCNEYWKPVGGKSFEEAIVDLISKTV